MGPEHWIMAGAGSALLLLGGGAWAGWALRGGIVARLEGELAAAELRELAQARKVEALLAQGEGGAAAARIVLDQARAAAEARRDGLPPRARRRLLLGADGGGGDAAADPASGEAGGSGPGARAAG